MKIIDLPQGSPEWLLWRKTVITATECPALLGISPYLTAYQAWQLKIDLKENAPPNDAMLRGQRLEPEARQKFIDQHGIDMYPACIESDEYSFLGASLDGLSPCQRYILEIKCNGEKTHHFVKTNGDIPEYHKAQMYHQLICSGAQKCYYVSFDGMDIVTIEVHLPEDFLDHYLPIARKFWKCVAFLEAPDLTDRDYRDMNMDSNWRLVSRKYINVDQAIKKLTKEKEDLKETLIYMCREQNCEGNGLKMLKTRVTGRIDYDAIPELKNIDLTPYRKPDSETWRIMINEKDK